MVQHLLELRDRLLRVVLVVVLIFLGLFAFANDLYTYLADPLLRHMVEGTSMIATQVVSPFLTPFKLALVLSVFIAVPFILYQAWGFMAPGLYQHEKRLVFPLLFSSTILFYTGMAFAYYVVFPLVFGFLTGVAPEGVAVMPDITYYLDFAIKMFFAFGLAFEVPIATILLVWSGITSAEKLAAKRPYVIVGAFVIGMLLTPPDVISQTLLAIPMWILFELGLLFSRFYARPKEADADEDEHEIGGGRAAKTTTAAAAAGAAGSGRVEPTFAASAEHAAADDAPDTDEADDANDSGHGEYEPLSDAEMDAELDRLEAEEAAEGRAADEERGTEGGPDDQSTKPRRED
ncbi:MAG: twin-arginine translocase subunit TatC [Gammaproteobacteria bacterium]|nr:twin-arginine translocase subunit TatC [Gammaproteobacteria bacterium]